MKLILIGLFLLLVSWSIYANSIDSLGNFILWVNDKLCRKSNGKMLENVFDIYNTQNPWNQKKYIPTFDQQEYNQCIKYYPETKAVSDYFTVKMESGTMAVVAWQGYEYWIKYEYWCDLSSYIWWSVVINLLNDWILNNWDWLVLQNDNVSCKIVGYYVWIPVDVAIYNSSLYLSDWDFQKAFYTLWLAKVNNKSESVKISSIFKKYKDLIKKYKKSCTNDLERLYNSWDIYKCYNLIHL